MSMAGRNDVSATIQTTLDLWFDTRPDGGRQPSWIQRGDCVITDTSVLHGSAQIFIAGMDGNPIDVSFTDTTGVTHLITDAGVIELLWDRVADGGVEIYVYEPPQTMAKA
jgi:hypothetical protein